MSLNLFVLFVHIGAINQPMQVECKWSLVLSKHPGFWDIFRLLKKFPHLANTTYCAILILWLRVTEQVVTDCEDSECGYIKGKKITSLLLNIAAFVCS